MVAIIVVVAVVVVALIVAALVLVIMRRRRTRALQEQFGPEYDEVLSRSGNRREAEEKLAVRQERHRALDIRPLEPAERERFGDEWTQVQRGFLDDPGGAVEHADALVIMVMRRRGYPVDDFEQRAADVSVAHPGVVEHYREARRIADGHRRGEASTEDLRAAVTSYRSLVEALLSDEGERRDSSSDRSTDAGPRGLGVSGEKRDERASETRSPRDGSRS